MIEAWYVVSCNGTGCGKYLQRCNCRGEGDTYGYEECTGWLSTHLRYNANNYGSELDAMEAAEAAGWIDPEETRFALQDILCPDCRQQLLYRVER